MTEPGARVASWFATFADLGRLPLTAVPTTYLIQRLAADFPVTAASWNWRDSAGGFGMEISPADALVGGEDDFDDWGDGSRDRTHPLLTWYARTGDLRPWTNDRVPTAMVSKRQRAFSCDPMRALEMEQQLSITYRIDGLAFQAFVLARGGADFSDDDVVVAGYIQRGLLALDAQTSLLSRLQDRQPGGTGLGDRFTAREIAVLQLLVDGCSTRVIGRRLRCSPRTVEKHLEHVYRKLAVKDRVNAVRAARGLGLREAPDLVTRPGTTGGSGPRPGP